jgi:hypothetical protein
MSDEATPCDACAKRARCQAEALACLAFQYWTRGFSLARVAGFPRQPNAQILAEIKAPKQKKRKVVARGNVLALVKLPK